MDILKVIVVLVSAYLVGGIPTAYLAGLLSRGMDVRRYGSGNVGASNAGEQLGKWYFALVALVDVAVKGVGPVLLTRSLGLGMTWQALAGLLAMIGHNWSPYLGFTGGRGLAAFTGSLLALEWYLAVGVYVVGLAGGRLTRNNALWFSIALLLLPLAAALTGRPSAVVGYCAGVLAITAAKRLLSNPGTAAPGLSWKQTALPRLLFDRDTWEEGNWVRRQPEDMKPKATNKKRGR